MPASDLPVVLVSAADHLAADSAIKEFLDGEEVERKNGDIVWEIRNKYYHCKVSVVVRSDGAAPPSGVEAHLVYLQPGEEIAAAQRRTTDTTAEVKLVATRAVPSDALRDWCLANHYELVSLDPTADEEDDDDAADAHGAARIRAALQAHQWPNLVRCPLTKSEPPLVEYITDLATLFSRLQQMHSRPPQPESEEAAAERRMRSTAAFRSLVRSMEEAGDDVAGLADLDPYAALGFPQDAPP